MKRDMTGGAVVMAVMGALGALGCPLRVTGLVPAAENAVGGYVAAPRRRGHATTAGAPARSPNTDAEGRLVLADAHGLRRSTSSTPPSSSTSPP